LVIYVATPYGRRNGNSVEKCERNVQAAAKVAAQLVRLGHTPFVPNLWHYVHLHAPEVGEAWWMELCLDMLSRCDVLLRVAGYSRGADEETQQAKRLGIPWVSCGTDADSVTQAVELLVLAHTENMRREKVGKIRTG